MHGFSINSLNNEEIKYTGKSFGYENYTTKPDELQCTNIFDYEENQQESPVYKWLDDYGWL
jgi:hypothetical protein